MEGTKNQSSLTEPHGGLEGSGRVLASYTGLTASHRDVIHGHSSQILSVPTETDKHVYLAKLVPHQEPKTSPGRTRQHPESSAPGQLTRRQHGGIDGIGKNPREARSGTLLRHDLRSLGDPWGWYPGRMLGGSLVWKLGMCRRRHFETHFPRGEEGLERALAILGGRLTC